jgi:outer membrane protein assembly factor BamB
MVRRACANYILMLRLNVSSLFAIAAIVAPLAAQAKSDSSWPHWRGPARDGVSRETAWSSIGANKPRWTIEVGRGYSNVSIAGGRAYTLGFDEKKKQDSLFCIDVATGRELWREQWPAIVIANFHGGGTLTTPSIDGDVVYVSTREGRCFAFGTKDHKRRWARDYKSELGLQLAFHGFSQSPLVLDDRLVLVLGGTIVAVDKTTGKVLWRTEDFGEGSYANPTPFQLAGKLRVAVFTGKALVVLDADTGKERYRYPWRAKAGGVNAATPIVFGDKIFISTAYNLGSALLELGDDATPKCLWRSRSMRNKCSGCVRFEDHIYGFDESMLKCIDMQGREKWRVRGLGMGAVTIAGRRLIVLSARGELIIGTASPEGFRKLSRRKVLDEGVYWTAPVLLDGYIYCRNSLGRLVCLDHRARGEGIAKAAVTPPTGTSPTAESLFANHARAIGGDKLRARRSLHVEGTIEKFDVGVTRTSLVIDLVPDQWQISFKFGHAGTARYGFDGKISWGIDPIFGTKVYGKDVHREHVETRSLHAMVDWEKTYKAVTTKGGVVFAGRSCWVVQAESMRGAVRRFYFDAKTGDLVGHAGAKESTVVYAQWRDFGGVKLPARTTLTAHDTGNEEIQVIERAVWDAVDPNAVALPETVRRLLRTEAEIAAQNRVAAKRYSKLLGGYSTKGGSPLRVRVTVTDGGLCLESKVVPKIWFRPPDAKGVLRERDGKPYTVVFATDPDGAGTGLVLTIGARKFVFVRDR